MTIICALHEPEAEIVWLGCNDRTTIGDTPSPGSFSKWLRFGDWAMGMSGDSVQVNFLELESQKFPSKESSPLAVIKFLRHTYGEFEIGRKEETYASQSYEVWCLLVHKDGRIWDLDAHLALSPVPSGYLWSRGSGMEYALGADYVVKDLGLSAEERVRKAVDAAIHLDTGCPGETMIEKFPG